MDWQKPFWWLWNLFCLFWVFVQWISVLFMDHLMPRTANNSNGKAKQCNEWESWAQLHKIRRILHCSGVYPVRENTAHTRPVDRGRNMSTTKSLVKTVLPGCWRTLSTVSPQGWFEEFFRQYLKGLKLMLCWKPHSQCIEAYYSLIFLSSVHICLSRIPLDWAANLPHLALRFHFERPVTKSVSECFAAINMPFSLPLF